MKVGSHLQPAGEWAQYGKHVPWTVAIKGKLLKSELLRILVQLPNRNELSVRWGERVRWTPKSMSTKIGARLTNVEAALIQIVGTESPNACNSCEKESGPFSHCVTAPGALECGNCHWGGNASRCTLPQVPITTPPPLTRRRTISEDQRLEWGIKRSQLHAERARLEQSEAALTSKIRDLHKKVDLVQRVWTRLGLVGQTDEAPSIYDEGWDRVTEVHDAINDLKSQLDAVMNALLRNQQEALGWCLFFDPWASLNGDCCRVKCGNSGLALMT